MPFTAPSLDQISKQLRKDLAGEVAGADPFIWPNNLYVALKVIAIAVRAVYLRLSKLHLQMFVSKAEGEYLDLHATDSATSRRPPTLASGNVTIAGVNGYSLIAGTRIARGDGKVYELTQDAEIAGDGVTTPVVAEDPGADFNAVAGTPLSLETLDDNVTSIAVDDFGIKGGMDAENDSSLRERLLDLKRNPPHGGSPPEYIRWVLDNKVGATRIYVQRAIPGPGEVTVTFMMDDAYADGIPLPDDVTEVQGILNANAPASAKVHAYAPIPVSVDVEIANLLPNKRSVQDAIRLELAAVFRRKAEPGSDVPSFFSRSWIEEAVSNAAGETSHILVLPADDVTVGVSTTGAPEIPVLGAVSFT